MESNNLLTIAIPTYNRFNNIDFLLKFLSEYIISTRYLVDVCVVDNASDYNIDELNKYANDKIKIYRNTTNVGFDRNILEVLNKSSGKYILFLGDDDIPIDENLDELCQLLEVNSPDSVFCNYNVEFLKKQKVVSAYGMNQDIYNLNIEQVLSLLGEKITFMSSLVIKKELINFNSNRLQVSLDKHFMHIAIMFDSLQDSNNIVYFSKPIVSANDMNPPTYNHYDVFVKGLGSLLIIFFKEDNKGLDNFKTEILLFVLSSHQIVSSEIDELQNYNYNKIKYLLFAYINLFFGIKGLKVINRFLDYLKKLVEINKGKLKRCKKYY